MVSSPDQLPSVDSLLNRYGDFHHNPNVDMLLFDTPPYQGEQHTPPMPLHTSPSLHTSSSSNNSPLSSLDSAMPAMHSVLPFPHHPHHHSLQSPQPAPSSSSSSLKRKAAEASATADEDDDKNNKRARNTMAARKYRQKRLDLIADLEKQLEEMTADRDNLRLQLARKDAEAGALKEMLAKK
jgi:hypothetical protein